MYSSTSDKKIKATISRYKSIFKKELKEYGTYQDGYGKRYVMFELYYMLDEPEKFKEYEDWYKANFPNDIGETVQLICWALLLKRRECYDEARLKLAESMLSNLTLIPYLNGVGFDEIKANHLVDDFDMVLYDYFSDELKEKIQINNLEWINELYESGEFARIRDRYIEIEKLLNVTKEVKDRKPLVSEQYRLVKTL